MLCSLQGLDELQASTLADVQAKSAAAVAARRPLARKPDKAAAVKLYNPRFEEDYVAGKDFDPDRCRAASRKQRLHMCLFAAAFCQAVVTMQCATAGIAVRMLKSDSQGSAADSWDCRPCSSS